MSSSTSMICLDRRNSLPRTATRSRCVAAHHHHNNNLPHQLSHHQPVVVGSNHYQPPMNTGEEQKRMAAAVSLQYISHYLTPDTLILPQRFLVPAALDIEQKTLTTSTCHHHHHCGGGGGEHQIGLIKRPETIDAATAQLEEIIRLCRTLQQSSTLQQQHKNHHFNHHHAVESHSYCSGCQISSRCRCSADCIRYFVQTPLPDQTATTTKTTTAVAAAAAINLDRPDNDESHNNHNHHQQHPNEFNGQLKMASTTVPSFHTLINGPGGGTGGGDDVPRDDKCQVLITTDNDDDGDDNQRTEDTKTTTMSMLNGGSIHKSGTAPLTGAKSTTPNGINRNRSFKVTALVAKFEQERKNCQQQPARLPLSATATGPVTSNNNNKSRVRDIDVNGGGASSPVGTTGDGGDGNHQTQPSLATSIKTNDGTSWDVDDDNNDNINHHHRRGRAVAGGGVQLPSSPTAATTSNAVEDSTATITTNFPSMATTTRTSDVVVCRQDDPVKEKEDRPDSWSLKISAPPPPPPPKPQLPPPALSSSSPSSSSQTPKPKPPVKAKPKPPPKPASLSVLSSASTVLASPTTATEILPLSPKKTVIIKDVDEPWLTPLAKIVTCTTIVDQLANQTIDTGDSNHIVDGDNQPLASALTKSTGTLRCGEINDKAQVFADPTIMATLITNSTKENSTLDHLPENPKPKITDLDAVELVEIPNEIVNTTATTPSLVVPATTGTNGCCSQSYCCCCCCGQSTGGCNHNLLGIDRTKIGTKKITTPKPKPTPRSGNKIQQQTTVANGTEIMEIASAVKSFPPTANKSPSSKRNKNQKSLDVTDVVVVKVTTEEEEEEEETSESPLAGSSSSSSGNSSSDEGIENPAVLDDDEEDLDNDVDLVKSTTEPAAPTSDQLASSPCHNRSISSCSSQSQCHHSNHHHSHHQHHFNHHNQLVSHHLPVSPGSSPGAPLDATNNNRKSPSNVSAKSQRTVSPLFPHSTTPDDVNQVERFLNGSIQTHLNALIQEESLLLKEIQELESEQLNHPTEQPEEEIDEELLEFQRIELEIKLSELRKCLQLVQKQIQSYRIRLEQEEKQEKADGKNDNFDAVTMDSIETNQSLVNERCQLDQAQQQVEQDISMLLASRPLPLAPLAVPETDTELAGKITPGTMNRLELSEDSEESDTEEPPAAATNKQIKSDATSKSIEDLLYESIENRLEKVNDLSEQEQESFVAKPEAKIMSTDGSTLARHGSQYDNERMHDCRMKHFGYQRNVDMLMLKSVYQRLELDKCRTPEMDADGKRASTNNIMMNSSSISNEMLESTTTATDSETDSIVLRRRSARFPGPGDQNGASNPNLLSGISQQSQDELSTHSDQAVLRNKRNSAISNSSNTVGSGAGTGSQRPLTLYMPAPNQKINLITHLHALGHDLTSSIVTNHLLLTPYTCSGYLYKHCNSSVGKWRKRYFHFDRVRKVFVYYHDRSDFEKMRHPKRGVFFDEIQDVYVDHTRINMKKFLNQTANESGSGGNSGTGTGSKGSPGAMTTPAKADGTRCVFVVSTATFSRKFILSTYTPELMRIWMDVIFTGAQAYLQDFDDQMN